MRREFVFDDGGMNLLSSAALRRIRDALPHDDDTTLFVFRSGRPSLFAAGADMAEMQRFTARDADDFARLGQELFDTIERLPYLTVALIDGDCFGGALDLTLAFDLRFATPRSRFAHPGARLGIVTGFGGTSRWRGVVSRPAAHQLFLANRVLSADDAVQMRLVDRVAETHDDELARLEGRDVRFAKALGRSAHALSREELVLLARRLAAF
ncbi:MAG: enoyl-CoA hydratase/isomerase family protein [Acidobacteria bacterium]|nr:enoyl-CoA hydratase/isomerase family protein [Acidobacteriota bacterium]MBV9474789.1 enoyl-CoA hydratase/isomerase family protein [Acidobacteriota bacterium]